MLVTSIFSFSHIVFYPIKNRNNNCSNIQFVVSNALNLVQSKTLLFGKELNMAQEIELTTERVWEKRKYWIQTFPSFAICLQKPFSSNCLTLYRTANILDQPNLKAFAEN